MQLFSPITIKNMTLKNRIVMSPMCMYSCLDESGKVNSWHKTHYASRAVGQVGLIIIEATAVTPQGRISVHDLGIWSDEHVEGLRELVQLVHEQDAKIGIQLAHAGRKSADHGEIIAPSALRFNDSYKMPRAMTAEQIRETIEAFRQGARRAAEAGFDVIEIHAAHGYLINQFLSPLTNHREDEYGGSLEGRFRFLREVIEAVQEVWQGPLFVRVSANEYADGGLTIEDHVTIARMLQELGVDLIDVSSGGLVPAPIDAYPGYQVPLAERIKQETGMLTGAVGLITAPEQAEEILSNGRADLVFLGRELLRDPYWPRRAAAQLGIKIAPPVPYERGW
ncbi:NADPH dehydrogenase [Insulibacter thermoxylanivorax]|uniref:NADPH dehydrogenase n=1 Tax=Insulibacter thermoxylanivorax TaxID=2749268 RepID=A0A916QCT9_9BACL|nr:NADPH dehydrogenase NamA [Insulibacter thermoxylanivorax]GFR36753.1 NADPH dehydrogenase [Insulibacter thermoxylanivorax]